MSRVDISSRIFLHFLGVESLIASAVRNRVVNGECWLV